MAKLNLGCGFDKREGWVNADGFKACDHDVLMDIETFPWPFDDNSFDYILVKHVLEHVGATFADFRKVMQELYRVIRPRRGCRNSRAPLQARQLLVRSYPCSSFHRLDL